MNGHFSKSFLDCFLIDLTSLTISITLAMSCPYFVLVTPQSDLLRRSSRKYHLNTPFVANIVFSCSASYFHSHNMIMDLGTDYKSASI